MAQTLTPLAELSDKGTGVADLDAVLVAATDANLQFINDGNLILFIYSSHTAAVTATLQGKPDPYGRSVDEVITVPIGSTTPQVGFFPFMNPVMFNAGGVTTCVLSVITNVKVGLYRLIKIR